MLNGCAVSTAVSVGAFVTTGKSGTDHAVGWAINRDCNTVRVIDREMPCQERLEVYNQNPL